MSSLDLDGVHISEKGVRLDPGVKVVRRWTFREGVFYLVMRDGVVHSRIIPKSVVFDDIDVAAALESVAVAP